MALGQLLLKLTVPGVPDIYQGDELLNLSLVDPDNRRPVDWDERRAALADPPPKLRVIQRTLALRISGLRGTSRSTPARTRSRSCAATSSSRLGCAATPRSSRRPANGTTCSSSTTPSSGSRYCSVPETRGSRARRIVIVAVARPGGRASASVTLIERAEPSVGATRSGPATRSSLGAGAWCRSSPGRALRAADGDRAPGRHVLERAAATAACSCGWSRIEDERGLLDDPGRDGRRTVRDHQAARSRHRSDAVALRSVELAAEPRGVGESVELGGGASADSPGETALSIAVAASTAVDLAPCRPRDDLATSVARASRARRPGRGRWASGGRRCGRSSR